MNVNWGILGYARIAQDYLIPAILKSKNATLFAIASRSREKLESAKERFNSKKVFDSYEEMLNDNGIQAVYIPLPNSMHLEWVIKAAEKKKHILCEKPLACTAEEILKMKKIVEKNGVCLMEAFAYRHSPIIKKVKSLLKNNEIGSIKTIEMHYAFMLKGDDFRLEKSMGGGAVYDVGCYNFNFMSYLLEQEPQRIFTSAEINLKTKVDMSCVNILEFSDGIRGISVCAMNHALCEGYRITGNKGVLEVRHDYNSEGSLKVIVTKGQVENEITVDCPDNYMLEVEYFSEKILNNELGFFNFEDSYRTARITDQVLSQIDEN